MTTLDLLKASYEALNIASRFKLNGNYKDSYELAGAIGDRIKAIEKVLEISTTGTFREEEGNPSFRIMGK